ncbi:MAG: hypothetical protein JJ934_17990 [Pseudomonadales bacterium]|nr:hypothetical protein [Pseudomonadales bacterium]
MSIIANDRSCGDCTACCDGWLKAEINGKKIHPGIGCEHADRGCGIYETRPVSPCRNFKCQWLLDPNMPEWMKPSRSKVILKGKQIWERPSADVPAIVASSVGPKIPGKTKNWLLSYAEQTGEVILCIEPVREKKKYTLEQRKYAIGDPGYVDEVRQCVEEDREILIRSA